MNHKPQLNRNSEDIGLNVMHLCLFDGLFPALQGHSSHSTLNNPVRDQPQVAQRKPSYQLHSVSGQPFVANLGETKLARKNGEGMSQLGFGTGIKLFSLVQQAAPKRFPIPWTAFSRAHGKPPVDVGGLRAFLTPWHPAPLEATLSSPCGRKPTWATS